MNFIKKIVDGKVDNLVHNQFQKFSRGEFKNRAIVKVKNSYGKFTISTTSEFSNELIRLASEKLGKNKTKVTGGVIYTGELDGLDYKDKKQFQGVKNYLIEKEMSGEEILHLMNKFPKAFFALSFEAENCTLKIKAKAPKSGKPGTKGEVAPKPDFCKMVTTDKKIAHDFVFEATDFKEAEINHTFVIEEIVIPSELKSSKDFAKVREESKRKGKIIRKTIIDGKEDKKEIKFEV